MSTVQFPPLMQNKNTQTQIWIELLETVSKREETPLKDYIYIYIYNLKPELMTSRSRDNIVVIARSVVHNTLW